MKSVKPYQLFVINNDVSDYYSTKKEKKTLLHSFVTALSEQNLILADLDFSEQFDNGLYLKIIECEYMHGNTFKFGGIFYDKDKNECGIFNLNIDFNTAIIKGEVKQYIDTIVRR